MKVGDSVQSGNTFLTCGVRTQGNQFPLGPPPVSIGGPGGVHFEGGPTFPDGRIIEQWLETKDFQLNANLVVESMRVTADRQKDQQRLVQLQRDGNKVDSRYKWSQAEEEE